MTTERLGVLVSRADEASERIGEQLLDLAEWEETVDESRPAADGGGTVYRHAGVELRTIEERHLDATGVAAAFDDPRLITVASRHSGDTGPLLTAHHTGNFGPAEHGGDDRDLARAAPRAHERVLAAFEEYAPAGYDVGTECTHHGPSEVGVPSLFVEVGSGPEEWADSRATRAAARAILDLADVSPDAPAENGRRRHLVGFGGGHYAPRFERIARETDWAVGHVAADWALEAMGDPSDASAVIEAAFEESAAEFALVADERPDLVEIIEALGYRVVGETWVRATEDVALPTVHRLEDAVGPVEGGLRFGTPATDWNPGAGASASVAVGSVPEDLLVAANAVDQAAVLAAAEETALAYDTENAGSRLAGDLALADPGDAADLLAALVDVLREDYDSVERRGGEIVARRREFDPDLAREAGVSPGPDFGRLSAGEAVTVDGERIDPEQVTVERERRFDATVIGR